MEYAAPAPSPIAVDVQGFLTRVFIWMFAGLVVTGISAALIGSSDQLLTDLTESPVVLIVVIVLQLGLVVTISAAINRLSPGVALALFFVYAASVGITFALIFE